MKIAICIAAIIAAINIGAADTLNLQWSTVAQATGYTVKIGQSSGNYSQHVNVIDNHAQIELPRGKYYIVVCATNSVGISSPSNEVVAYTESGEIKLSIEYQYDGFWLQYMWFTVPVSPPARFWRVNVVADNFQIDESIDLKNWISTRHEFFRAAENFQWRIIFH